jgi:hypothetical protein
MRLISERLITFEPDFSTVVQAMVTGAKYWSQDERIQDLARYFKCERMTKFEELFDWVRERVTFRRDPTATEWLRDPIRVFGLPGASGDEVRQGDCDDVAMGIAAILLAKQRLDPRYGCRYIFCQKREEPEPSHVFIQGQHPRGGWVTMDPLFSAQPGQIAPGLTAAWKFLARNLN